VKRTGLYAAAIIGALASGHALVYGPAKRTAAPRAKSTTESDLVALAKAQRKRERKAAKRAAEQHREKMR
jgi:hypothetical protein